MFEPTIKNGFLLLAVSIFFNSCPAAQGPDTDGDSQQPTVKPAIVTFRNNSIFRVDIYKNLNPEHFDPTALVCTLNPDEAKRVEQYPSHDPLIGDAFFPRYKCLLENRVETGTTDIYADAQRVLSNITFVIESGAKYTKTIPQPGEGEVNFISGYIKIQNQGDTQIRIIKGDTILQRMDNGAVYLEPNSNLFFFEIPFSPFDETITMNHLKAYSSFDIPFPSFTMERGKLYSFIFNGSTIEGPDITVVSID